MAVRSDGRNPEPRVSAMRSLGSSPVQAGRTSVNVVRYNGDDAYPAVEEESVGTMAASMHRPEARLSEHQVVKGGSVYYFNAPHKDNHPSLTAVKVGRCRFTR